MTQISLARRTSLSKLKREPIAAAQGSWFYVWYKTKNMFIFPSSMPEKAGLSKTFMSHTVIGMQQC